MAGETSNGYSSEEMSRYFKDRKFRHSSQISRRRHKILLGIFLSIIVIITPFLIWYYFYIVDGLPSLERLENPKPELATRIYSSDSELLDQFFVKNRNWIVLDSLPKNLVLGLIATEDKEFYNHWGVHLGRFIRAGVKNILAMRIREGASTITQQLARNLYFKPDRSLFDKITRKFREWFSSVQIERNFTKNEILELYLNVTYFGRGAYGIESASQTYFNKSASKLRLSEYTFLIGLLQGPGYYDPIAHMHRAIARREIVIYQMLKEKLITPEEAQQARNDAAILRMETEEFRTGLAPHYVEGIRQQLLRKAETYGFDIYRDGLMIYTSLDSRIQRHAIKAVEEHLLEFQKSFDATWNWDDAPDILRDNIEKMIRDVDAYKLARSPLLRDSIANALRRSPSFIDSVKKIAKTIEVAVAVINPHNGHIVGMIGGKQFRLFKYGLNHATQIRRQPGSAFKVFVYTVAIDNGYPPCYELLNQPVTILNPDGTRWTPGNIDGSFGGKYTLREGIKHSINLLAIRAILEIAPVKEVVEYSKRMGIYSPIPPYPSIALGTAEVTPLELTSSFGVLANEGIHIEPISILKIEDKDGNIIEQNFPEKREVLSKETAYLMTNLLEGVVNGGTGGRVRQFFNYPAAGKTGTTTEYADAWFVGYTPDLVAGIWVGFDDNRIKFGTSDGQGGRAAAPIFGRLMQGIYNDPKIAMNVSFFNKPEGIVRDTICAESKKKATENCPTKTTELIIAKYPLPPCDLHRGAVPGNVSW